MVNEVVYWMMIKTQFFVRTQLVKE